MHEIEYRTRLISVLETTKRFSRNSLFFPTLLLLPLVIFTILGISGSSIGVYHKFFYGDTKVHDKNLILGEPRPIRGDEWNFVTQIAISQSKNHFSKINASVGQGMNLSVLQDVPYWDWSALFKPHNLIFFILPFDNAFAFKWWFMLYLLIIAAYFFVLSLLPKKRFLAAVLALGFAFNPLIQWWYLYGTLGSIYYSLFAGIIVIQLLRVKKGRMRLLWGVLLAYVLTCFALVLYPPFQIPCALVIFLFLLGYLIERLKTQSLKVLLPSLGIIFIALVTSLLIVFLFIMSRNDVFQALANTAYPGKRVVHSGDYSIPHLLSGQLSTQIQNPLRSLHYRIGGNESEASNFILLLPFLFLPGILLLVRGYRSRKWIDWPLLTTSVLSILLLVRLYIPHTDLVFKLMFLGSIPHERVLIGVGLLSFVHMVLVIRNLSRTNTFSKNDHRAIIIYSLLVWAVCLSISIYVHREYPGFIGLGKAIILSVPIPLITLLFLSRRFNAGASVLCAFLLFSSAGVNPLYRNVTAVANTQLSKSIQDIASKNNGKWATESYLYEQFPMLNGAQSLTGVYPYPQLSLWKTSGESRELYNRYAHINLLIDRDTEKNIKSRMLLVSPDTININTEPCSAFLQERGVKFMLTNNPISDNCVSLLKTVGYPTITFYIYRINYP